MANGNPFFISPAASQGAMQGLGAIGSAFIQKQQQDQAQQEIQGALASNDPLQVQQVMAKYPEMAQQIESGFQFRSDATRQNMADSAFRILQGEDWNTVIQDRAAFVQQMGGDPTQTLEGLDLEPEEQLQAAMMMLAQYGTPQQFEMVKALGLTDEEAATKEARTAQQKNLEMLEEARASGDPQRLDDVLRILKLKTDVKLSSLAEKQLDSAVNVAIEAGANARSAEALAQNFDQLQASGGVIANLKQAFADFTGLEDAETKLRTQYDQLRKSQVINNLPPGAASDRDIDMILSGFPRQDASPEYIAEWLRAFAKVQRASEQFNEFKANYISTNKSQTGMLNAWKTKIAEDTAAEMAQMPPKPVGFVPDTTDPGLPPPLPGTTQGPGTVGGEVVTEFSGMTDDDLLSF